MGLIVFTGWESITEQALFWAGEARPIAARRAVDFIGQRLIAVEASPTALRLWAELVGCNVTANPTLAANGRSLFGDPSDA